MKTAYCAVLLLFCSCPALFSQTKHASVKLMFECQCKDDTGSRFAAAFQELLEASPRYAAAEEAVEEPAGENVVVYNWHLKVISVDGSSTASGANAALSLVLLRGEDIFVWQSVQMCGRQRADACARSAFATMDDRIATWGN
jgi:hypothetical protein